MLGDGDDYAHGVVGREFDGDGQLPVVRGTHGIESRGKCGRYSAANKREFERDNRLRLCYND